MSYKEIYRKNDLQVGVSGKHQNVIHIATSQEEQVWISVDELREILKQYKEKIERSSGV